ncbi:MAG: hypothetical protein AYP45_10100 [Candidatus Brocadia carolinensis]|uniref:Uncharacterized protein n=1 Tax=Candidatus Brocadia carolinensis TaxID=1004156 RepID=A0A1V4AT15_9BACT|nr:MAG: hypothetical protein AYP45_10100 [Candidatus Brocadia caroliniensis]
MNNQNKSFRENSFLYGLAFDNKDSHKRITTGENFYIAGGSAETHENLVEKVLEFSETIKKYGKKLDDLSESEFYAIAKEISSESGKMYWFFQV